MNQSQKTSNFLKAINKFAKEQSDAIKREVEQFKKQEIEKANQEGIKDAYELIQKEIGTKKSQIVSDIARREQNSRKELFNKRNEITQSVFDDVREKLKDFVNSDDYTQYLKRSAQQIAELFGDNDCVIYIKEQDSNKVDMIKTIITDCTVEFDESIELGGIKAYCKALNILADNTLDSKLDDEYAWFAENSGLKVV